MKKQTEFFELICEDLTSLGGPMGTEHVTEIFRKALNSIDDAKEYAEKDHKKRDGRETIRWKRENGGIYSGDLLSHDYVIRKRTIG